MADTPVDRVYREARDVLDALKSTGDLSLQNTAHDHFRKALLLSAASYFESRMGGDLVRFVRERAAGSTLLENFVTNKAVSRQFHTWFRWDETNANHFFGLFGADFRTTMVGKVKASEGLRASIRAFLEVGGER